MLNDTTDYLPNDLLVKTDRASMYFGLMAVRMVMKFMDEDIQHKD